MCPWCNDCVETYKHLLECQNVQEIWNVSKKILKFGVSWEHIVVGFYHELNEKPITFANLISFLALRIYNK